MTKITSKNALSMSTTMTITNIVAMTSHSKTRASLASSNGKISTNKSSDCRSAGNYHLVILSKKRMGDVPHKSPGNKALMSPNSNTKKVLDAFAFALFFELDVWQHLPQCRQRGLLRHEFWRETGQTQSVDPPVEICFAHCTDLGNHTAAWCVSFLVVRRISPELHIFWSKEK